jgi:hypothetical protein
VFACPSSRLFIKHGTRGSICGSQQHSKPGEAVGHNLSGQTRCRISPQIGPRCVLEPRLVGRLDLLRQLFILFLLLLSPSNTQHRKEHTRQCNMQPSNLHANGHKLAGPLQVHVRCHYILLHITYYRTRCVPWLSTCSKKHSSTCLSKYPVVNVSKYMNAR